MTRKSLTLNNLEGSLRTMLCDRAVLWQNGKS